MGDCKPKDKEEMLHSILHCLASTIICQMDVVNINLVGYLNEPLGIIIHNSDITAFYIHR